MTAPRESNFNSATYSEVGTIGFMQVLPTKDQMKQLKDAGILTETKDLFGPDVNIASGKFIFNNILHIKKTMLAKLYLCILWRK